jgi:hypothetical protein
MPVPETAVDEKHLAAARKNQVRIARQIGSMQAVAEAHTVDHAAHRHLGSGVLAPDAAHDSGALGGSDGVHGFGNIINARGSCRRNPALAIV